MTTETQKQPEATERRGEASELSAVLSRIESEAIEARGKAMAYDRDGKPGSAQYWYGVAAGKFSALATLNIAR